MEIIEEKEIQFTDTQLCEMFGDMILFSQDEFNRQLKAEDFNYEVFGIDYYAEKFPHFDPMVWEILANVSKQKIIDLRDKKQFFKELEEPRNPFKETEEL